MTSAQAILQGLEEQLWRGLLEDSYAPQTALLRAIDAGADYRAIERGLRKLWRLALPGEDIAARASSRWPNSIDMAAFAVDFGPPEVRDEGLARLEACVTRANRRRAVLANAYLRWHKPDAARVALMKIDPKSSTAADDIQRRAELSLLIGDADTSLADIVWLAAHGRKSVATVLHLLRVYRQTGARACADVYATTHAPDAAFHAQAFEIFLGEGDFARASSAFTLWQFAPNAPTRALIRAKTRLALERGDSQAALAMLKERLDLSHPWRWDVLDHLQWLRAGLAQQADTSMLAIHADAALRLNPRHEGLAYVAWLAGEQVHDWQHLSHLKPLTQEPRLALVQTRAALRMGLSGRAAITLAQARRTAAPRDPLRAQILRAEALYLAGRPESAIKVQRQVEARACDAVQRAEAAFLAAELAHMLGKPEQGEAALASVADAFPDRMSLWLITARICFQRGDFERAAQALVRFNTLKTAQFGTPPPPDLRDLIVQDATAAARGLEHAFTMQRSVEESVAQAGLTRISASSGLCACLLARAQSRGELTFHPDPAARIPKRIVHYWQGPEGPALSRAKARWQALHPGFECLIFDADTAQDWLAQTYDKSMVERFRALSQPAARADLFRLCWIVQMGGIFADLDEYPRIPVTRWLAGARAVLCVERGFGTVANNFIAAVPDHPIPVRTLDLVCDALDRTDAPYAWWHCGPAQWSRATFESHYTRSPPGVRILSQAEYCRRVSTNLPYPHKRSPDHWR